MFRPVLRPLFIISVALISACAGTPEVAQRPAWVDGQSERYASQLYLTGQGSAGDLAAAKDRARADLAKQFEVAVQERSQQQQTFRSSQQSGEAGIESLEQSVSRQLITETTRTVAGMEIAETWLDESTQTHHALAVLSRNKARQRLQQQIEALDQQTRQHLAQAEQEKDLLRKIAQVQQAIEAQGQRREVQSALQVVDPSGRGQPPSIDLAELQRSRDRLIQGITLLPQTEGPLAFLVQPILSGNAAGAGFQVGGPEARDYTLIARIHLQAPLKEAGWTWLRGNLELILRDRDNHDVGLRRWPLKVAATSVEAAENRLLNDIDWILKNDLRPTLLGFALTE